MGGVPAGSSGKGRDPGVNKIGAAIGALCGVSALLIGWFGWIVVASRNAAAADARLQQNVEAQFTQSAGEAMGAGCWSWGGHGSGSEIRAFNAQLPVALAALLAKPETKALPLEHLERVFTAATGRFVKLFAGDSGVLLAQIAPLYCAVGDHDGSGSIVDVVDHGGHFWEIGRPRGILAAQWVEDRWIATADVASTLDAPPAKPELWVISRQKHSWALTDKLLRISAPEIQSMTYSLEDGYRTLIATVTTSYGEDPPCEAIGRMPGYRNTIDETIFTYRWVDDHYQLIRSSGPRPVTVIFATNPRKVPGFSGVKVTPYYYEGTLTPLGYEIDDWQPLCQ